MGHYTSMLARQQKMHLKKNSIVMRRTTQHQSQHFEKHISRNTHCVSLRGSLLRLMMAGLLVNSSIWMNFVFAEIISLLSIAGKEGLHMVVRAIAKKAREDKSFVKCFAKVSPWETCFLYRLSLLMSQ